MNTPAGHERLFNLTCALLTTKRGLTKQEIFSTVQGYKEQLDKGVNKFALERQFERDKATLKDSGIYFITENPYYAMEDNQEIRYRIPPDDFTWAAGVSLSPRQLALLQLAAKAWANASMSEAASQGLIRLKALGETLDDHDLIGLAPRLVSFEPALYRLTEAVERPGLFRSVTARREAKWWRDAPSSPGRSFRCLISGCWSRGIKIDKRCETSCSSAS